MLSKLIKHEFRATARLMLPALIALLALAALENISARILAVSDSRVLNIIGGLIVTLYVLVIIAACVVVVVQMVQRFQRNLLTTEGYLMFTLPTSVHSLVWSKIIVSVVWFAATAAAVVLSFLIVMFKVADVGPFFREFSEMITQLNAYYALNGAAIVFEVIAMLLLVGATTCLLFYAALSLGYSFANHKTLLSVVFFFAFSFAIQIIFLVGMFASFDGIFSFVELEPLTAWHSFAGVFAAITAVCGAILYFVTTLSLKKRLNLE